MKHLKKFNNETNNETNRVDLFKVLYREKDYMGAAKIVLSGWGTKEPPLDKNENRLINNFISSTSKVEQEQYDDTMRRATGTFG